MKLVFQIYQFLFTMAALRASLKTHKKQEEEKAAYYPDALPDANQDGLLDEGDFIKGFGSSVSALIRS